MFHLFIHSSITRIDSALRAGTTLPTRPSPLHDILQARQGLFLWLKVENIPHDILDIVLGDWNYVVLHISCSDTHCNIMDNVWMSMLTPGALSRTG